MKKLTYTFLFLFIIRLNAQPIQQVTLLREEPTNEFYLQKSCDRNQVIKDYFTYYEGTEVASSELGWTGNVDNCDEGTISEIAMNKTLERINYFRRLVGIPNGVIFNTEKNEKCQKAVLMMQAAGTLDHYPTLDWKCASEEGVQAASKSNLSYGRHSAGSIPQYIQDSGTNNGAVGHRRWILFPKAYEFGFGSSNWGTALWVIGGTKTPDSIPDFVAYPSPGYFPKPLVYQRWSFSKGGAKFNEAIITMTDKNGNNIPLITEKIENGYGDNTIVWVPEINTWNTQGEDLLYHVKIQNVLKGGNYFDYAYDVMAIDMVEETNTEIIPIEFCEGSEVSETLLNVPYEYTSIIWDNGSEGPVMPTTNGIHIASITDLLGCIQMDTIEIIKLPQPSEPSISGSVDVVPGNTYEYSIVEPQNDDFFWEIENGEIITGDGTNEIEVTWNSGEKGSLCAFYISQDGCLSKKGCVEVSLLNTGLDEFIYEENTVYPNPFSETIKFKNNTKGSEVQIFNSSGRLVHRQNSFTDINTSNWASGVYYVKMRNGVRTEVKKLIKI